MYSNPQTLQTLAEQARSGDLKALAHFRKQLEPHMVRIVRRALRTENESMGLTQQIRAAARRLPSGAAMPPGGSQPVAQQVARQFCDTVVGRLRAGLGTAVGARDTYGR